MVTTIFKSLAFRLRRSVANLLLSAVRARNSVVALFDTKQRFYAEFFIDRQIRRTFFPDLSLRGCLVEVGCATPELLSVSKHFRDCGWRCIGIEPNPKFAQMHRDAKNEIYEYAASDFNADDQDFVVVEASPDYSETKLSAHSYSSLSIKPEFQNYNDGALRFLKRSHIKVKVRRLDEILRDCAGVSKIDCVVVDVEGYEIEVMRGFTPSQFGSPVIILENLFHDIKYEAYMKSINYCLHGKNHYNYIFVPNQHVGKG